MPSVLVMLWPLTPALSASDIALARLVCAVLAVVGCVAIALLGKGRRPTVWSVIAGVTGAIALAALYFHFDAVSNCVANYDGQQTIIGREYTADGEAFVRASPKQSSSEQLLDAGGQVGAIWTESSITQCRFWVSWGGLLTLPLLAVCVCSLVARRGSPFSWTASSRPPVASAHTTTRTAVYDAFISYRRLDRERAEALVETLESLGFRVAIDFRDFRPNEPVLVEMERCIGESRFLLCVITSQYATSGFTNEEAIMAKLLDLNERRNRIVPLVFDHVPMPAWLGGLVGVNFTATAQIDPIEKLTALLSAERDAATPRVERPSV